MGKVQYPDIKKDFQRLVSPEDKCSKSYVK